MKFLGLVCLTLCGCGVSKEEATTFATSLAGIADVDASMRDTVLTQLCSEIKGCASGCSEELGALSKVNPADALKMMQQCSAFAKGCNAATHTCTPALEAWVHGQVKAYAGKAREKLEPADAAKLDAAMTRLQL